MIEGITLRQAALIAGFGILIMAFAAPFAEYMVYPKLVIPGDIEGTTANIAANMGLFVAGIFAYLITFILDPYIPSTDTGGTLGVRVTTRENRGHRERTSDY